MAESSFPLFRTLNDWYELIINNVSKVGDYIAKPLNELDNFLPDWLDTFFDSILGNVGNHSLIGFMLGTGFLVYLGWSVVKFFLNAFPG